MKKLAVAAALALLAGCATVVQPGGPPNEGAWQARLARLGAVTDWRLAGRIGVVTPERGGSASLDWAERGASMRLTFSGPFGLGAVRLWGDPAEIHVRDSKGREWVSDAPEDALARSLGWPLPVASLRYWVLGRPAPGSPYRLQLGNRGLLVRLEQQGWTVRYQAYRNARGLLLPERLAASRAGTRIKLIVSRWTLPPAP